MAEETLTITDNRTGRRYEVPIRDGAIAATDLQKITSDGAGSALLSYDPAFLNTASCRSAITFIDGERSILRYRGYPVEELAERSSFLEVAYLLIHGELPDPAQHREWVQAITHHTLLHENIKKLIDGFHHDAHPMGILVGTVGALSTFYPDAKDIFNVESRRLQILRLIAKMPTLAAFAARHAVGMPYACPDNDLSYSMPPSAFRSRCFRCCLRSGARPAGWRSGKKVCSIPSRRSCDRGRSRRGRPHVTCPAFAPLGKQPEPAQAEQSAGHQDDGAQCQQRHGEIELGRDPTDS